MNTITLEFDKDDLKHIRARHYDGSTSELNKYCTALKLQIRRAAPRYWFNASDLAYICEVGRSAAAELFWDYMHDGDLDLFEAEKVRLINREKLRYDMCMIAECMILEG